MANSSQTQTTYLISQKIIQAEKQRLKCDNKKNPIGYSRFATSLFMHTHIFSFHTLTLSKDTCIHYSILPCHHC